MFVTDAYISDLIFFSFCFWTNDVNKTSTLNERCENANFHLHDKGVANFCWYSFIRWIIMQTSNNFQWNILKPNETANCKILHLICCSNTTLGLLWCLVGKPTLWQWQMIMNYDSLRISVLLTFCSSLELWSLQMACLSWRPRTRSAAPRSRWWSAWSPWSSPLRWSAVPAHASWF